MDDAPQVPPGVDPARPSPARVYDYLLGGRHNFEADRAVAEMIKAQAPEIVDAAWANRGFHQRAAKWIAEHGIRQFIDIGSGLPTVGNTHQVVRLAAPDARVVYVDNDPMVLAYGTDLLGDDQAAAVILADMRDPAEVLGNPELRRLIDFTEPVGLLATAGGVRGRQLPRAVAYDRGPEATAGRGGAGQGRPAGGRRHLPPLQG